MDARGLGTIRLQRRSRLGIRPEDCAKVSDLQWREFEAMRDFGCCFVLTLHPWTSAAGPRASASWKISSARCAGEGRRVVRERAASIADYFRGPSVGARRVIDFDAAPVVSNLAGS